MNGFLLRLSNNPLPSRLSKFRDGHKFLQLSFGTLCIDIDSWGDSSGDIHMSHDSCAVLILMGYISQSNYLPPRTVGQQNICNNILKTLGNKDPETFMPVLADSIHGSFTMIYVQPQSQKVYTITDRVNSRPLWYSSEGSRHEVLLSSNTVALACASGKKEYYPGNVAGYLLYGTAAEPQKSIFSHIGCQTEGSLFTHTVGNLPIEKQWYIFRHHPDTEIPPESWASIAADRLVKVADRLLRINPRLVVFLSGGVDSRLAATAFTSAGAKPILCSLGDAMNLELRIAKLTARVLNCKHVVVLRDAEWYLRSMQDAVLCSNGTFSWAHSHFSQAYKQLKSEYDIDAAVLGDFCEAFSKLCCTVSHQRLEAWTEEEFVEDFDKIQLPLYRPVNRKKTLRLIKRAFRQEAEESIRRDIADRYSKVSQVSSDPLIIGDYFFRWQTTSCIATFQMFNDLRSAGPEQNLMFDKDLHELLEIMPSSVRNEKQLGAKIIRRLNPGAAMVPNSNTLLPLIFPGHLHSLAKSAKPILGKIRRRLFSNTYKTTASWPHLPLLYVGHPAWKRKIEQNLLEGPGLPIDIFDRSAVEKCWYEFCSGDFRRHADIERLLGFSVLNQLCN